MKQTTPYYCGPACIEYIAVTFGPYKEGELSQSSIAGAIGTTTEGTGIKGIRAGLRLLGLKFSSLRGKQRRFPTDHAVVWDRTRDHWLVAHRVFAQWNVFDPENGATSQYDESQFRKAFFNNWDSYGIFWRTA